MVLGPRVEEEAVVVDELVAAVQVHEGGHVDAVGAVEQLRRFEVEVRGPEVEGLGKVGDAAAEVAEFVDFGGACWEGSRVSTDFLRFLLEMDQEGADLFSCVGICCLGGAFLSAAERHHGQSHPFP